MELFGSGARGRRIGTVTSRADRAVAVAAAVTAAEDRIAVVEARQRIPRKPIGIIQRIRVSRGGVYVVDWIRRRKGRTMLRC